MVEVIVVTEGQSEETFVRDVLAPQLAFSEVYATARCIPTSPGHRGGALSRDRVFRYLRNTLKERSDTYVTTLFDLYALDSDMPGIAESKALQNPSERAQFLAARLHADVMAGVACRAERLLPYIQPYEFEALFFADIERFCSVEPAWAGCIPDLQAIKAGYINPEWINGSSETTPSSRLKVLVPRYRKVRHGSVAANRIGLDRIRAECPHFAGWVNQLLRLPPLTR